MRRERANVPGIERPGVILSRAIVSRFGFLPSMKRRTASANVIESDGADAGAAAVDLSTTLAADFASPWRRPW